MINTHFRNSFTYRPNISGIAQSQSLDSCLNVRTPTNILQIINPFGEYFGFANFNHDFNVAQGLHIVNRFLGGLMRC